jgi:hypothetical protein
MILHTDSIKRSSAIYKFLQQTLISSLLDWNLQTSDNSCIFPRRMKHISLHHFYNNPNFFSLQSQRPTFTQISGKIIMEYFNLEAHCFCVIINLLHTTPMWINYQNPYISLYQYQCVHDTLYMCIMTEYHLVTYSWDLHTEHMQGFSITSPFPVKPDSHCSFLGISISLITDSM